MKVRLKSVVQLFSLICIDIIAYYIALLFAVFSQLNFTLLFNFTYIFSRENFSTFTYTFNYLASIPWIPIAYIFILQIEKLYMVRYPFWEESRVIFKSVSIAIVFIFVTIAIRNMYGSVSKSVFFYLWLYMVLILPFVRYWGKKLLYKIGIWKESVLIIGSGESAVITVKGLSNEEHLGYDVIGLLDDSKKREGSLTVNGHIYKIYRGIRNIKKFVNLLRIETVFIANPASDQEVLTGLVNEIYKHVKRVVIIPDIKGVAIFNSELHYLFMEKLFMIKINNNLNSTPNIVVKRIFDFVVAGIIFIIILAFLLIIALLIKLTSRGPVLYTQKRIGKNGREFQIYKFRTMYMDAEKRLKKILQKNPKAQKEWDNSFKLKDDPRRTPIGRFLRRTSIDEFPQIINILRGEMSLVGPRPVVREEIEKYYGTFKQYYYSVYPGLAGLWQVSGRSDTDYQFRVQTDVWYVQNWSLWLDIIIMFKAVAVVLKKEGAY